MPPTLLLAMAGRVPFPLVNQPKTNPMKKPISPPNPAIPSGWHKLVYHGKVIAEGSQTSMVKIGSYLPGSFVALGWRKSMLGQPWKLATVPRSVCDSKTLLNSGHNSTI